MAVRNAAEMAESRKETPSSVDPEEKKSSFDDEIGKGFYGSWKSPSVAGDDAMDFSFDTVSTGKKNSFNFDKMDLDFTLDGDFDKLITFKVDMPDIDFSSPSKKTAKLKESSKGESSGGSHQGKPDSFNFSFDFNELDDGFNFASTLTEGKKISENSNITDDDAPRIEQQGSKLNMAGCSDALDDYQTDNLPDSDNATPPTVETTTDCAAARDTSNIGELVLTHEAQTSPQKSLSVSPKDEGQQIYLEEKEKSTEPVARDTTQVLHALSCDGNDSTQATESDTETGTQAPEVNTESVIEQSVTDRNIDILRCDPDNSQLKNSDPPHNNESGSNMAENEKADSETRAGNMIGTVPMQDDLDGEVTSAATLSQTRLHSDASNDIQKPTSIFLAPLRSELVVEKVIPTKENEPEVGSSKVSQRSNETEPQPCQPSSVGGQVSSAVNKGLATSYPANGKREGIFVYVAETQRKLTGDSKSLSMELTKGEPALLGSKKNAKDLCNIREGFNGDRIKNASKLGTIPTQPDKEATKGDSILLGSGMNNKDLNNFDSTDKATKPNTRTSVDSATVVLNMTSTRNLKIGSSEGLKTMRRIPEISSLKISSGSVNPASSTDKATKSDAQINVDSRNVVSNMISTRNLITGSPEGLKTTRKTPDASSLNISRNIGVSEDHSDATLRRELSSLRKSDKDREVQGSTTSKIVHPIERKTSAITSLKRKTAEASNAKEVLLHPQKRLSQSPSENRNLKGTFGKNS